MNMNHLRDQISKFLEDIGYQLYDLQLKKRSKQSILTIFIDKDEQITMDDCVNVTEQINPFIDELDPIKEEYFLEVSSPGAEKELRNVKQIQNAVGSFVHIETYEQKIEGTLESFENNEFSLRVKNKVIKIYNEDVNLIRLAIKF